VDELLLHSPAPFCLFLIGLGWIISDLGYYVQRSKNNFALRTVSFVARRLMTQDMD
jgi:hypothetical protein